jgi:gliding motility-associated lipoprotein GldH
MATVTVNRTEISINMRIKMVEIRKKRITTVAMHNRFKRYISAVITLVTIILCLGACSPKHSSYSDFKDLPIAGWQRNTPYYFTPEYGDSSLTYDIRVAVRHDNQYAYQNLAIVVDFIRNDSLFKRCKVNFALADDKGNWTGSGFGAAYQDEKTILTGIRPDDVSRIVVWQGMSCERLTHISSVGVFIEPSH